MTTLSEHDILNLLNEEEAILKKLPAYETYEKFENNKSSSDYSRNCGSLVSTGNEAKELCENFAKNLQSICKTGSTANNSTANSASTSAPYSIPASSITSSFSAASTTAVTMVLTTNVSTSVAGISGTTTITTTTTTKKSINIPEARANCLLLKYWLFNKIKKLSVNQPKETNLDTLIHTIYDLQFEIYKKQDNKFLCFNDIYEYFDNWEEEKYLYEYFMNFPKIENFNKTECEACKKYVNHIKKYYNKKKEKDLCCKDNYFKCIDYFNCNPKYHPDELLTKINCTNTIAEVESVPRSTLNSVKSKATTKTRIENHRCTVRRIPDDPHLAYLSCFKVPTVYKNVDDYFVGTDMPQEETGNNSEGKVASSSLRVGESATNTGSPSEGSENPQSSNEKNEEYSSDSSPKDNILDQVKSLLGLGTYLRNIIDNEYPLFKEGKKTTIQNNITLTSTTQASAENVPTQNIEENLDLLEPSDNLFNTKRFKSIMTAILTFGVIFVFFLYYKFTPLGSCLSRRCQKKEKFLHRFKK